MERAILASLVIRSCCEAIKNDLLNCRQRSYASYCWKQSRANNAPFARPRLTSGGGASPRNN